MKANIGTLDRTLRIVLGLGILSLYFVGPRTPWALLGLIPLATAMINFCPLYALFRFSTRRIEGSAHTG